MKVIVCDGCCVIRDDKDEDEYDEDENEDKKYSIEGGGGGGSWQVEGQEGRKNIEAVRQSVAVSAVVAAVAAVIDVIFMVGMPTPSTFYII